MSKSELKTKTLFQKVKALGKTKWRQQAEL